MIEMPTPEEIVTALQAEAVGLLTDWSSTVRLVEQLKVMNNPTFSGHDLVALAVGMKLGLRMAAAREAVAVKVVEVDGGG